MKRELDFKTIVVLILLLLLLVFVLWTYFVAPRYSPAEKSSEDTLSKAIALYGGWCPSRAQDAYRCNSGDKPYCMDSSTSCVCSNLFWTSHSCPSNAPCVKGIGCDFSQS